MEKEAVVLQCNTTRRNLVRRTFVVVVVVVGFLLAGN